MPNKIYSLEWLNLANRNLETARVLLRENHYTDSIAIEIHQTIEKSFKAVYAYFGISIPRTHTLTVLFNFVSEKIPFDNIDIEDIITISDYYETDRYPGPRYILPSREEVERYFQFAQQLLKKIEEFLD
ncbi:MAG: HEPN domain-containing protein [Porphyromonadaceae bacterium]|nr:MAG: HEPN domain-containing protein [Porphyromonadaceae bacterium]